ncbi:MAG: hypothetical protein IV085_09355 [Thiobacillus sp.]|nr:hypothetical protein [Thiobacillus sp.]
MMKITRALAIVSLVMVYSFPSQAGSTGLCVETVEASLEAGDPKVTLEQYFNCEKYEGSAYEAIASGSKKWVRLAEKMLPHSDACYTEGIQASLGRAMQRSPKNVLPLVDKAPTLSASHICLPFISNEIPIRQQLTEVANSRLAIQGVHDHRLQIQKAACLKFIGSLEANLNIQASPKPPQSPNGNQP